MSVRTGKWKQAIKAVEERNVPPSYDLEVTEIIKFISSGEWATALQLLKVTESVILVGVAEGAHGQVEYVLNGEGFCISHRGTDGKKEIFISGVASVTPEKVLSLVTAFHKHHVSLESILVDIYDQLDKTANYHIKKTN